MSTETSCLEYLLKYLHWIRADFKGFTSSLQVMDEIDVRTQKQHLHKLGLSMNMSPVEMRSLDTQTPAPNARENVMTLLIRLSLALTRIRGKDLFPYDPLPLMRLLKQIEKLYESENILF